MSWPLLSLGDIFDIGRGGSPRPIDAYITDAPEGVNWVSISDASSSSKYIDRTKRRIRAEGASRSRSVNPGDFLLTNSMSFGRPYIMRTSGCIHDGWLALGKKREGIDHDFFFHLLGSEAVYSEFARLAAGVTVKNLNIELVKSVRVPVPPIAEQRRIAEVLDRAETLRAQRRQALAQLDALAESTFLGMFGDVENNSHGWPVKGLDELNDKARPIGYGILMPGPDQPDGTPYVRVVDMKNGEINFDGVRRTTAAINHQYRRSALRAGDLLISIRGHVGRMARVPAELDGANITQDSARIAPKGVDPIYLLAALRSGASQRWMQKRTRGVAVQGLNIGDLRLLPIPLPPLKVQEQFSRTIGVMDEMRRSGRTQALQFDALFAALQHRAFRGEL